jgi:ankyrin repeat protein
MSKLVRELSALDEGYLKDPLTTGLHVAAREGRTKIVAALLSFGADADAKDKVLGIVLSLSCARVLSLSSY